MVPFGALLYGFNCDNMAAPLKQWTLRTIPHVLNVLRITQGRYVALRRCHLSQCTSLVKNIRNTENNIFEGTSKAFYSRTVTSPLTFDRSCRKQTITKSHSIKYNNGSRRFGTSTGSVIIDHYLKK